MANADYQIILGINDEKIISGIAEINRRLTQLVNRTYGIRIKLSQINTSEALSQLKSALASKSYKVDIIPTISQQSKRAMSAYAAKANLKMKVDAALSNTSFATIRRQLLSRTFKINVTPVFGKPTPTSPGAAGQGQAAAAANETQMVVRKNYYGTKWTSLLFQGAHLALRSLAHQFLAVTGVTTAVIFAFKQFMGQLREGMAERRQTAVANIFASRGLIRPNDYARIRAAALEFATSYGAAAPISEIRGTLLKLTAQTGSLEEAIARYRFALDVTTAGYSDVETILTALSKAGAENIRMFKQIANAMGIKVTGSDINSVISQIDEKLRGIAKASDEAEGAIDGFFDEFKTRSQQYGIPESAANIGEAVLGLFVPILGPIMNLTELAIEGFVRMIQIAQTFWVYMKELFVDKIAKLLGWVKSRFTGDKSYKDVAWAKEQARNKELADIDREAQKQIESVRRWWAVLNPEERAQKVARPYFAVLEKAKATGLLEAFRVKVESSFDKEAAAREFARSQGWDVERLIAEAEGRATKAVNDVRTPRVSGTTVNFYFGASTPKAAFSGGRL
jgi:hypothetical protein